MLCTVTGRSFRTLVLLASILALAGCAGSSSAPAADAGSVLPHPDDAADRALLVGNWAHDSAARRTELSFSETGAFEERIYSSSSSDEPDQTTAGQWTVDGGVLVRSTGASELRAPFAVLDSALYLEEVYLLEAADDPAALPAGTWVRLEEQWSVASDGSRTRMGGMRETLELAANGTYVLRIESGLDATAAPPQEVHGTWQPNPDGAGFVLSDDNFGPRTFSMQGARFFDDRPAHRYDRLRNAP